MQRKQLLAESNVFQNEVFPRPEANANPAEDVPEQVDHDGDQLEGFGHGPSKSLIS
jgi:hypothetical protein